MPYIEPKRRSELFPGTTATNCGELNYTLTMLVLELDDMRGAEDLMVNECMKYLRHKGLKYQHANDVVGACISAGFEYFRRTGSHKFDSLFMDVAKRFYFRDGRIGDYEDTKIASNGDLPYPVPTDLSRLKEKVGADVFVPSSMTTRLPPR
jgi:hypothetical protein